MWINTQVDSEGSVQLLSHVQLFVTPLTAARQVSLAIPTSRNLPKLMSIESVMPSNHLTLSSPSPPALNLPQHQFSSIAQSCSTLCNPMNHSMPGLSVHHQLLESIQTHVHWVGDAIQPSHAMLSLPLLPQISPSIRVFSNESALPIRWPKNWSFSFIISPSNEHPGMISFRMDWLDFLAVQGTFKSLQHHSSNASILQRSAFFIVQLSHPYMSTAKTIALTRRTFVGKVMSLLFNMLSKLVITFIPRTKRLLILWLQSPSAVILEPRKIKSASFHIYLPWSDGTRCDDLSFLNVEL